MSARPDLYRDSLGLLTDLYQLTMAHAYWKAGVADREAVFHLFFRRHPFAGGFTVACGLEPAARMIEGFGYDEEDLAYLATLEGSDGSRLFDSGFLDELRRLELMCDVDAVPEGTIVFPHEPLLRVRGPIWQGQLLETPLLNIVNYQTLVATKAARLVLAAGGDDVLEFGLRRAQGIDGGLAASRAAFVGGCSATSNVMAGKLFGIPVRGTHAHSWVMAFDSEQEAFDAWAEASPNNCVFLVDTYDTLEGVRRAVRAGLSLRERGYEMIGVRLDSGDLAYFSKEARRILDQGGFPDAEIFASNDLDEHLIESLKQQGAAITVWGVGTKLVTAWDDPALGGGYKLSALADASGQWQYRVKLSEQAIKISNPGIHQVRRYWEKGEYVGDVIYDTELGLPSGPTMIDAMDMTRRKVIEPETAGEDLLVPVFRTGRRVAELDSLTEARARAERQLAGFHDGIKRFVYPHQYPVGLEERLFELKTRLVLEARGLAEL